MEILQENKLKAALEKAKRVGRVEEPVTIAGCAIVLRSLMPEEYADINDEVKDLEEIKYLNAYQVEHLCRSIVEVEGVDLREVELIEIDDEKGEGKTVKLEKHAWLRDRYLKTWSREAIVSAWRKMLEVFAAAEAKAKEGIHFTIAEETDEEKFRRVLGEMKEAAGELPDELVLRILDDEGLMLKATKAELDSAAEKLAAVATSLPSPIPEQPPQVSVSADELMRNRTPLNQEAVDVPTPPTSVTVPAQRRAEVPEAIRQAAVPTQSLSRAAQIAAMEGEPLPDLTVGTSPAGAAPRPGAPGGKDAVRGLLDRPPVGGINPRFQPRRT